MNLKWCLFLMVMLGTASTFAQRKNQLYYTNYQYQEFDENPTIQRGINDGFANFGIFNGVRNFDKWYDYLILNMPVSRTIGYQRYLKDNSSIRLNILLNYFYGKINPIIPKKDGQIMAIHCYGGSLDYVYNLKRSTNERHWLDLYGGAKFRYGTIHVYIADITTISKPSYAMIKDYGINLGASYTYFSKWNVFLKAEAGYGRWIYLEYNGWRSPPNKWGMPRSSFDMRASIGYTFGKKIPTLKERYSELED